MTYSKRHLYALGEPLGNGATRAKQGGGYVCGDGGGGGGGSSSSQQATTTTTSSTDKRQVVDSNSVGVSSDSSTVTVYATDNLAFGRAADSFDKVLGLSGQALDKLLSASAKNQELAAAAVEAYKPGGQDLQQRRDLLIGAAIIAGAYTIVKVYG